MKEVNIRQEKQPVEHYAMFVVQTPQPADGHGVARSGRDRIDFLPLIPKRHQGVRGNDLSRAHDHGQESTSQNDIGKQSICPEQDTASPARIGHASRLDRRSGVGDGGSRVFRSHDDWNA